MPAWKSARAFLSMAARARYWGLRAIGTKNGRASSPECKIQASVCGSLLSGGERGLAGAFVVQALERQDPLQSGDAARAELAPSRAPQLVERLAGRAGGAVDAGGEHRVEGVGDVDDPRAERDLLALEAIRVAR